MSSESEHFTLQFVGIGPQRTGTSWLHEVLEPHPNLCLPSPIKETMFFDKYYPKGFAWYQSHFANLEEHQLCGEIGPTYFQSQEVRERIFQHNPKCKIIVNIRNPIDHIFSLYLHELSKGRISGTLSEAIKNKAEILDSGHYAEFVPLWRKTFGSSQIKFVWMDQIKKEPQKVYGNLCAFLGIPVGDYPESVGIQKINAAKYPRFPLVSRIGVSVYHWLRANRLHHVLEIAKSANLDKITFSRKNEDRPELTEPERVQLLSIYEDDIAFLESESGMNLAEWREKI